jgi:hypothetical protein
MKNALFILVPVLLATCISCATTVPVTVTKPAEVNMAETKNIAVLGFSVPEKHLDLTPENLIRFAIDKLIGVDDFKKLTPDEIISDYTTERFILTLVRTNYFHVMSAEEVKQEMGNSLTDSTGAVQIGKAVEAQAILNGEIYSMETYEEVTTTSEYIQDFETETMKEVEVEWIARTATLGLKYYVFNTRTGALVAAKTLKDSTSMKKRREDEDLLASEIEMYKTIVDSFMPTVARQLAPYTVRESRRLMKDKKNSAMKLAGKYAKSGVYDKAMEIYLELWKEEKNRAAGHNAAILYEVTGNVDAAISLIRDVLDVYPERKILKQYNRMLDVKREQERLAEQLV